MALRDIPEYDFKFYVGLLHVLVDYSAVLYGNNVVESLPVLIFAVFFFNIFERHKFYNSFCFCPYEQNVAINYVLNLYVNYVQLVKRVIYM